MDPFTGYDSLIESRFSSFFVCYVYRPLLPCVCAQDENLIFCRFLPPPLVPATVAEGTESAGQPTTIDAAIKEDLMGFAICAWQMVSN
jgi:hypothetical protein